MSQNWSKIVADRFSVSLPPDVEEYFDSRVWKDFTEALNRCEFSHLGGFTEQVDPERLLDPASATVWGGQMLPDTLPILENGGGDVIAMRFSASGVVSELIQWWHEGGIWRPFGQTLAEAILCDVATTRFAMEDDAIHDELSSERPAEHWAVNWVCKTTGPTLVWPDSLKGDRLCAIRSMLDADLCEHVLRQESCLSFLECGFQRSYRKMSGESLAEHLGLDWPSISDWYFDTSRIPVEYHAKLSELLNAPIDDLIRQDWDRAAEEARRVQSLRPDLGWPFGVMGWAADRLGDSASASTHYLDAIRAMGTSSAMSFLRLERDFLVKRINELRQYLSPEALKDPQTVAALLPPTREFASSNLRRFWMSEARKAEEVADHRRAYNCYYRAGWDDYCTDDMDLILDGLVRSAEGAGMTGLAHLAAHHRASLDQSCSQDVNVPTGISLNARIRSIVKRIFG